MGFKKGHKRLPGAGRKKGQKNKNTGLKELLRESLTENRERAKATMNKCYASPKRLIELLKVMASLEPKTVKGDLDMTFTFDLPEGINADSF